MVTMLSVKIVENWKNYLAAAVIALVMAVTVRVVSEISSGQGEAIERLQGRLDALDKRLTKLETSTHPATTKRYTSDDAARDKAAIYQEIGKLKATCSGKADKK